MHMSFQNAFDKPVKLSFVKSQAATVVSWYPVSWRGLRLKNSFCSSREDGALATIMVLHGQGNY